MNISQAKDEIKRTINAYLQKGEAGNYIMEERFCRPVLLMGAPGIGKTAIMQQIADELRINLVSYTITHHTRQSAIGLPVVEEKEFEGKSFKVTEYTMSEIIASVYNRIDESGINQGILFLDEINCVSETLLPTMLQFLQYKTFGTHKVPRGFVIVCAGNPPKYNRSARDFDIVTLDRVKTMEIDIDNESFFKYAAANRVHGCILAFLDIKKEYFYSIKNEGEDTYFVTARSWEDLSEMMYAYERLGYEITKEMISEYVADADIAEDFYTYYTLYEKYRNEFAIGKVLSGEITEGAPGVADGPFDERLSLLHLLYDALAAHYYDYTRNLEIQLKRQEFLKQSKDKMSEAEFEKEKAVFETAEDKRQDDIDITDEATTRVFSFIDKTFGQSQEMVLFLTMLSRDALAKEFLADIGNEAYSKYSKVLLLDDRKESVRNRILELS